MPNLEGGDDGIGAILVAALSDVNVEGTISASGSSEYASCVNGQTGGGIKVVSTGGSTTVGGTLTSLGGGGAPPPRNAESTPTQCIRIESSGTALIAGATITPTASVAGNITPLVTGL
jgi:hypothetical protein